MANESNMRRDMNLIRCILLKIEEHKFDGRGIKIEVEDYLPEVVMYHIVLLKDAGLITTYDFSGGNKVDLRPSYLTWEGTEFLAAVREDKIWNKMGKTATREGFKLTQLPISIVTALAIETVKNYFGL